MFLRFLYFPVMILSPSMFTASHFVIEAFSPKFKEEFHENTCMSLVKIKGVILEEAQFKINWIDCSYKL